MHCHILVPELLVAEQISGDEAFEPASRALETLLARGRRRIGAGEPPERWLLRHFGVRRQRDWPAAPYSLLGDGGSPGEAIWMRADPVHLRLERDRLILVDDCIAGLAPEEAVALTEAINAHFAEELRIDPVRPGRWYARLEREADIESTPTAAVRGRSISACLPAGADSLKWRSIGNELQMLLNDHPLNLAREARGDLPINSLWFWGAGRLAADQGHRFALAMADDPLALGLAKSAGAQAQPLPAGAAALIPRAPGGGEVLVVLGGLRAPAAYGDPAAWRAQLAEYEKNWFGPLLDALRDDRIGMVTIFLPGEHRSLDVEVARADLRRFWRRRAPLAAYLA